VPGLAKSTEHQEFHGRRVFWRQREPGLPPPSPVYSKVGPEAFRRALGDDREVGKPATHAHAPRMLEDVELLRRAPQARFIPTRMGNSLLIIPGRMAPFTRVTAPGGKLSFTGKGYTNTLITLPYHGYHGSGAARARTKKSRKG